MCLNQQTKLFKFNNKFNKQKTNKINCQNNCRTLKIQKDGENLKDRILIRKHWMPKLAYCSKD